MNAKPSTSQFADRAANRRNFIVLAGFLATVLIANGVISLFAIQYTTDKYSGEFLSFRRAATALEAARTAQVHFKKQVQEWKNILIRGSNPDDFSRYRTAFDQEEKKVQEKLSELQKLTAEIGIKEGLEDEIRSNHLALGAQYRAALGTRSAITASAAMEVDQKVHGVDRKPTDDLDAIVAVIQEHSQKLTAEVELQAEKRYKELRTVSISATSIGLALVLVFLGFSFANKARP